MDDLIGMLTRHGMAAIQSPNHMSAGELLLRARDRIVELEAALESAQQRAMTEHASDCSVHNGPAYPAGPCDCGFVETK